MILTLQILAFFVLVALSAYFAGTETGSYRMSRIQLRLGAEKGKLPYRLLTEVLKDNHGLIMALLMGNNLVNYLATILITMMFLNLVGPDRAEYYATIFMTPMLFLFAENVPKNLFYYRANRLMIFFAPLTWFIYWLFTLTGGVPLLKWVSRLLIRVFRLPESTAKAVDFVKRQQVKQFFHETAQEGLVSEQQKKMMDRLVRIAELPVSSVMIPVSKVKSISVKANRQQLLEMIGTCTFTRLPVYEGKKQNILGYINVYQMLGDGKQFESLESYLQPLLELPSSMNVLEAIEQMQKNYFKMALIKSSSVSSQKEKVRYLGILTLKDLLEELTGELS